MGDSPPVGSALVFSDIHLGWTLCSRHHARWLRRLPEAVDEAELVVLNGDIVDGPRGAERGAGHELVAELVQLVDRWRRQGRRVVYLEGNHDPNGAGSLRPEGWSHDFQARDGRRVRVLHGHRFSESERMWEAYDRLGWTVLSLENRLYGRVAALRSLYPLGPGWPLSALALLECSLARRALPRRLSPRLDGVDVLLHGHVHYGPGRGRIGRVATWRTGAWVSPGHLRSADRMLRYRSGRFERIGWSGGRWRALDDGR
jgi:UDP-2,3-diacylglucosamine pyrophosphatase LpxH